MKFMLNEIYSNNLNFKQDWIFDVPAFCGLDCGLGKCHSEREGSAWLSRYK